MANLLLTSFLKFLNLESENKTNTITTENKKESNKTKYYNADEIYKIEIENNPIPKEVIKKETIKEVIGNQVIEKEITIKETYTESAININTKEEVKTIQYFTKG